MSVHNLARKIVVVTGGANGIGASIVKEFLKENVKHVAVIDVDTASGTKLERELVSNYSEDKVKFHKCDVTKDEQLFSVFDKVIDKYGGIDLVVNNAAVVTENMKGYKNLIEVNYTAVVTSTLKAIELMRVDQGGRGGTIINISSNTALMHVSPFVFVYGSSKSAVLHFSNSIGLEPYYRHTNVRVITMCFGATATDVFDKCETYDKLIDNNVKKIYDYHKRNNLFQSCEIAAQGVVQSYKEGKSGSTWLVDRSKIEDITDRMHKAYEIMYKK